MQAKEKEENKISVCVYKYMMMIKDERKKKTKN